VLLYSHPAIDKQIAKFVLFKKVLARKLNFRTQYPFRRLSVCSISASLRLKKGVMGHNSSIGPTNAQKTSRVQGAHEAGRTGYLILGREGFKSHPRIVIPIIKVLVRGALQAGGPGFESLLTR